MKFLLMTALLFSSLSACVTVNHGNGTYTVDGSNGRHWLSCVGAPEPEPFPGGANGPGPRRLSKHPMKRPLRGKC